MSRQTVVAVVVSFAVTSGLLYGLRSRNANPGAVVTSSGPTAPRDAKDLVREDIGSQGLKREKLKREALVGARFNRPHPVLQRSPGVARALEISSDAGP